MFRGYGNYVLSQGQQTMDEFWMDRFSIVEKEKLAF